MAVPSNTFQTYAAVGNAEDVSNIIYNIAPTDTPFMSTIAGKNTATATLHQWQTDTLAAAAGNAVIEGDDATLDATVATVMRDNYTQISDKTAIVSYTQDAVKKHGRPGKELAYQVVKKGEELKRDMEYVLTQNQADAAGDATTARTLRSLEAWYTTNDNRGTSGADGSTGAAATDGDQRAFTETLLKDVLQKCFVAGGNPDVIMMGPINKQKFSSFTGVATKMHDDMDRKTIAAVDVYVSDFGTLKAVPNRFQRERTVHILESDKWAVSFLQDIKVQELYTSGLQNKRQIWAEYTLESRNEAASGVVADVTTS